MPKLFKNKLTLRKESSNWNDAKKYQEEISRKKARQIDGGQIS